MLKEKGLGVRFYGVRFYVVLAEKVELDYAVIVHSGPQARTEPSCSRGTRISLDLVPRGIHVH